MSLHANLAATRASLHSVAEHVLANARQAATGRIGLQAAPGGFATPPFGEPTRRVAVEGAELVVFRGEAASRHELTTLGAAAAAAEVDLHAWHGLYEAATSADPHLQLIIETTAAALLADWFALTDAALADSGLAERAGAEPSPAQLWPEHFDLARSVGECNLGGSPGDAEHQEPYLYVGPWDADRFRGSDPFWNEPFGASLGWRPDLDEEEAIAFFRDGLARVRARGV